MAHPSYIASGHSLTATQTSLKEAWAIQLNKVGRARMVADQPTQDYRTQDQSRPIEALHE